MIKKDKTTIKTKRLLKRAANEVRQWQDHHTGISNTMLSKTQSQSMLDNVCPWCEFSNKCEEILKDGKAYKYCKIKSWELQRTWVRITTSKSKVLIGTRYGKLVVINERSYIAKPFKKEVSKIWWVCICDCGNHKTALGYNLLAGRTKSCGCIKPGPKKDSNLTAIYKSDLKKWRYTIGSATNPDGMRHIVPTEHSGKVGQKTDHIIEIVDKNDPNHIIHAYEDDHCDWCNSLIRENSNDEKQCENPYCGLIA